MEAEKQTRPLKEVVAQLVGNLTAPHQLAVLRQALL
jgi:hypothetical protein